MFDSIVVRQASPYPQVVHEHRAPTDESVSLLKELEEKAENKIVESVRLENNIFKAVYRVFDNPRNMSYECHVQFSLNGRNFIDKFDINHCMDYPAEAIKNEVLDRMHRMLAKHLTAELLFSNITVWKRHAQ